MVSEFLKCGRSARSLHSHALKRFLLLTRWNQPSKDWVYCHCPNVKIVQFLVIKFKERKRWKSTKRFIIISKSNTIFLNLVMGLFWFTNWPPGKHQGHGFWGVWRQSFPPDSLGLKYRRRGIVCSSSNHLVWSSKLSNFFAHIAAMSVLRENRGKIESSGFL